MESLNEIRQAFSAYFQAHDHLEMASGPLVPTNDPTLMFTNSGMVQFKSVFTGQERPKSQRAVTAQKCVRAGGKHNDLENVGYTTRHHTFFEMLGNFSFGDYFKDRAIELAWKLITDEWNITADRLLVTVHASDDDSLQLWKSIAGLPESRIIRIDSNDNFWSMGDAGPNGPCSEIFFDHGDHLPGGPPGSPDEDGDRFVEIWNLVFMQNETDEHGVTRPLPRPSIDTGMGLERVGALMQGTHDNFQCELFVSLIDSIAAISGVPANGERAASHRVIADHLRAITFLISDGVWPSNIGRGYVLRRILRRALRHAHILGVQEPILYRLIDRLVELMGNAYPELLSRKSMIKNTCFHEETRFLRTLARGMTLLDMRTSGLTTGDTLDGESLFQLYDTYGFPVDLTHDALRARGIGVDLESFEARMEVQRERARENSAPTHKQFTNAIWYQLADIFGPTEFLGYDQLSSHAEVQALVVPGPDGERGRVESFDFEEGSAGNRVYVILKQTPFYAESGGQVGDRGTVASRSVILADVEDTQKSTGGLIVHHLRLRRGSLNVGQALELHVAPLHREEVARNHTATHMLHAILRSRLGDHIAQQGSHVSAQRLRFDFSHPQALERTQLTAIEEKMNEVISHDWPVVTTVMERDEAIKGGAMALFGEKYADDVRVVSIGPNSRFDCAAPDAFSEELCGGTHVSRTGKLRLAVVMNETAVGAGIRRIELTTANQAIDSLRQLADVAESAAKELNIPTRELVTASRRLKTRCRKLERQAEQLQKELAVGGQAGATSEHTINQCTVQFLKLEDGNLRDMKHTADSMKRNIESGVVVLASHSTENGKATLVVGVTKDKSRQIDAVALVNAAAPALGGSKGGGRSELAQTGGPLGTGIESAFVSIRSCIEGLTSQRSTSQSQEQ